MSDVVVFSTFRFLCARRVVLIGRRRHVCTARMARAGCGAFPKGYVSHCKRLPFTSCYAAFCRLKDDLLQRIEFQTVMKQDYADSQNGLGSYDGSKRRRAKTMHGSVPLCGFGTSCIMFFRLQTLIRQPSGNAGSDARGFLHVLNALVAYMPLPVLQPAVVSLRRVRSRAAFSLCWPWLL